MALNLTQAKSLWRTLGLSFKLFATAHLFLQYGYEVHDKYHHAYGKNLRIGDLVVASRPGHPETYILKRLVGKPGDLVLRDPVDSRHEYIKVPQGHLWIVGDNLAHSTDSRHYGPVPMGLVKGKVLATVYPTMLWFNNEANDGHTAQIACGRTGD